jgi:hypothetical protein
MYRELLKVPFFSLLPSYMLFAMSFSCFFVQHLEDQPVLHPIFLSAVALGKMDQICIKNHSFSSLLNIISLDVLSRRMAIFPFSRFSHQVKSEKPKELYATDMYEKTYTCDRASR